MPHKLLNTFEQYAGLSRSTGSGLDSSKFRKICKDSRIFDQNFKEADADLIFTKVKNSSRKLDFEAFKVAINMCAEKKGVDPRALVDRIYETTLNGPSLTGTVAESNRFHDDMRTYTGVHKAGGPTTIDSDKQGLNNLLDRSSADVRGVKKDMREAHGRNYRAAGVGAERQLSGEFASMKIGSESSRRESNGGSGLPMPPAPPRGADPYQNPYPAAGGRAAPPPQEQYYQEQYYQRAPPQGGDQYYAPQGNPGYGPPRQQFGHPAAAPPGRAFAEPPPPPPFQHQQVQEEHLAPIEDPETELYNVYLKYCSNPETAEMDSSKFVKFCKDSGIIDDRTFKMSDADLLFQRSKKAGNYGKKITYEEFRTVAFPAVALKKEVSQADLAEIVIRLGRRGPSIVGTIPLKNRFHDDRSTYTGVHVAGGPSIKNDNGAVTMESLLDRSDADVRGVKAATYDDRLAPPAYPAGRAGAAGRPGSSGDFLRSQYQDSDDFGAYAGGAPARSYAEPPFYDEYGSGSAVADPYSYSPQAEGGTAYAQPYYPHHSGGGYQPQEYYGHLEEPRRQAHPSDGRAPAPTLAGQANKKGGIYDRLSNPTSFTGVYAERFKSGDGRINGDTVNKKSNFRGNTNTRTDEQIHDLSQIINRR